MSFTVKLASFPAWKAPVPHETLGEAFTSVAAAFDAGKQALAATMARELAAVASIIQPRSERLEAGPLTVIDVPSEAVSGFLILDETGVEVGNWTTLDEAVQCAAQGRFG